MSNVMHIFNFFCCGYINTDKISREHDSVCQKEVEISTPLILSAGFEEQVITKLYLNPPLRRLGLENIG